MKIVEIWIPRKLAAVNGKSVPDVISTDKSAAGPRNPVWPTLESSLLNRLNPGAALEQPRCVPELRNSWLKIETGPHAPERGYLCSFSVRGETASVVQSGFCAVRGGKEKHDET